MKRARRYAAAAALALVGARAAAEEPSPWSPPLPRSVAFASALVRPYFHLVGPGGGVLAHLRAGYYFERPFVVYVEASPAALVFESSDTGAITHARLHGGYADDLIEVGVGVGGRVQRYGPSGLSLAGALRLGALDGLHVTLEYVYSLARAYRTRPAAFSLASTSGTLTVPLGRRLWLEADGGFGFDFFAYGTLGLRHRVRGDGGAGTLDVLAGAGFAWVVDRFPCLYTDPEPCVGAAGAGGPTLAAGASWRF